MLRMQCPEHGDNLIVNLDQVARHEREFRLLVGQVCERFPHKTLIKAYRRGLMVIARRRSAAA